MKRFAALLLLLAAPAGAQQAGIITQAVEPPPPVSVPMNPPPSTVIDAVGGLPEGAIVAVPENPLPPRYVLPPRPFRTLQPAPDIISPPEARKLAQELIRPDDYPPAAIAMNAEGWVDFRLVVGPDGRVATCTVTASSGSRALDSATCRIMRSRGRFTPAIDSHGNPAAAAIDQAVEWRLPTK
jgi:protein TonB